MASIDTGGGDGGHKKGPGVKKAKKLSTRVDMTPMVDLGFLLITFFVFTATMSSPTTLDLNMPKDIKDQKEQTEVKESSVLSIMLGKDNQIFYYEGKLTEDGSNFKSTTFKGIRDIIVNKKKEVMSRYVTDPECEAKARAKGRPISECADKDFVVIIKRKPLDVVKKEDFMCYYLKRELIDEVTMKELIKKVLI